jgi:Predicted integral membrane protein (DUF2275)/Putative zinc-finger
MEHNDIRHKLSEYIDGSVTGKEQTAIETHLKTCRQCSNALQELRKTIEHVRTVEEINPPAWMTQKIMTKVRAEAEEKKSIFQRFFYPLTVKLPIQAIAVLFVAVTGFYIYQAIQPSPRPSDAPNNEFAARNEVSPAGTVQDKLAKADGPAVHPQQVPQSPQYKALDMKQEYEKPAPPVPESKTAVPAPAPAKPAEQAVLATREAASGKMSAAPQAGAPAMMREHNDVANESGERMVSKRKSTELAEGTAATPDNRFEHVVQERYPDDKPKLVVTFDLLGSHRVKHAEERFNSSGERHGLQREYYESGRVKTEAHYVHGKLEWYREFQPDGVKKIGKSDFDWFWLKK